MREPLIDKAGMARLEYCKQLAVTMEKRLTWRSLVCAA
jgi:hypothetical protein